jgi:hypothetical protein
MPTTAANIQALLTALNNDLLRVNAAAPGSVRTQAQLLISQLTSGLQAALMDDEDDWGDWVSSLGPLFTNLATDLKTLFGDQTGACNYPPNGCIPSTNIQCNAIPGSTFVPGGTCNPVPPPPQHSASKRAGT